MKEHIIIIEAIPPIKVHLRKSLRAKRIILRVKNQHAELVIPSRTSINKAKKFLFDNQLWLIEKISNAIKAEEINVTIANNQTVRLLGNEFSILFSGQVRGKTYLENGNIVVSGYQENIGLRVKRFIYQYLKEQIILIAEPICETLKVKYKNITINESKTRWGSCSSTGNITFCWRLAFACYDTAKYVIAHELCHLIEMNHSKKFWQLVEKIIPNYQYYQNNLKTLSQLNIIIS